MKTLRFLSQLVLTAVLISGTAINASAQKKADWKQKIMQEKIAFFTTEMDLTQEEAQNFWPVYNQFCKEEHEAQKLIMTTYKDLNEAIESGKSEKEISACLNRYLKAREEKRDLSTAAAGRFRKFFLMKRWPGCILRKKSSKGTRSENFITITGRKNKNRHRYST